MKNISIVVPCYNEAGGLRLFYEALYTVIHPLPYQIHILFVNDGSTDRTWEIMEKLRAGNPRVETLSLSRNFGKELAMLAGLDYADGDAVIIMDADLQDPPELIPRMLELWEQGWQDVYARRRERRGESWLKRHSAGLYYRLLRRAANIDIPANVGDFRLLDRQAVDALCRLRERKRYTKGLFSWIGFRKKEIVFDRPPRAVGKTKWNYLKLCGLALDGLSSFSELPLRLASVFGLICSATAFLYMLFIFVRTLLYGDPVAGYPSLVCIILFIGGIQLIVLGIMGEYIGRIYSEAKHRPDYIISAYHGVQKADDSIGKEQDA